MQFGLNGERTCLAVLMAVGLLLLMAVGSQAAPRLKVTVVDTAGGAGQHNSVVTVFFQNTMEEVAAFELWLQLSRPDICLFQTEMDTVVDTTYWFCTEWSGSLCVDSIADTLPDFDPHWDFRYIDTVEAFSGEIDTSGTLISGWDMVVSRSLSATGTDVKVSAIADRPSIPGTPEPIGPGSGVLFKLLADILPIPDTMQDRTVEIIPQPFLNNFSFSRPDGTSIGIRTVSVPDTSWYKCMEWSPPPVNGCADWDRVNRIDCGEQGCDSFYVQMVDIAVLDTDSIQLVSGHLTVDPWKCGDVNGDTEVTIGDVSMLIDNLFITLTPIVPIERGNTNCSTEQPVELTIGDVSALIDRLFITLNPLCCE